MRASYGRHPHVPQNGTTSRTTGSLQWTHIVQHRLEQHTTWLENQDSNVFFQDGVVSSVIDWDKAEQRDPAEEVVRALHLALRLDVATCQTFVDGYRSVRPLPADQLHQAAERYGHLRARDLWLYETVYLDGDSRPRRFFAPGRFVPFIDEWRSLEAALVG